MDFDVLEDRVAPAPIPVTGVRDLVYDETRQLLYMTTSAGKLQRYDVANQQLLNPFTAGLSLNGADITPNGAFVYATSNDAVVRKINLTTEAVTNIATGSPYTTQDLVIANNGKALVGGNQSSRMVQIDLSSKAVRGHPADQLPTSSIFRSLDEASASLKPALWGTQRLPTQHVSRGWNCVPSTGRSNR